MKVFEHWLQRGQIETTRAIFGYAEIAAGNLTAEGRALEVQEAMLNKWSSEGSEDHHISLDAFIALVDATGAQGLLGFVPGEFGLTVIEDEYVDLIEAQLLDEHLEEVQERRAALALRRRSRR